METAVVTTGPARAVAGQRLAPGRALCGLHPATEPLCLLGRRSRDGFQPPRARRFAIEHDLEPCQLFAAGEEQRHFIADAVLLQTIIEPVRAHAEIVDRQDLIVDVDTRFLRGAVA